MAFDAVLFDFNSVLVPLQGIGEAAFVDVLQRHDIDGREHLELFAKAWGRTDARCNLRTAFAEAFSASAIELPMEQFYVEYTRRTLTAPEVQGAGSLLRRLSQASIRTGLITYTPRSVIERQLQVRGWSHHFVELFPLERFTAPRPDPSAYRTVTAAMGVSLGRTVAIEHSALGIAAARRAGLSVVHLGCNNEAQCTEPVDYHALDLNDVSLDVLGLTVA